MIEFIGEEAWGKEVPLSRKQALQNFLNDRYPGLTITTSANIIYHAVSMVESGSWSRKRAAPVLEFLSLYYLHVCFDILTLNKKKNSVDFYRYFKSSFMIALR